MIRHLNLLSLTLLLATSTAFAQDTCKYDTQCKGDRICEDGRCVASDDDPTASVERGDGGDAVDGRHERSRTSTTCRYTSGPKAGQVQYFRPGTPGLVPATVGQPCTDGAQSWGEAIPDRRGRQ